MVTPSILLSQPSQNPPAPLSKQSLCKRPATHLQSSQAAVKRGSQAPNVYRIPPVLGSSKDGAIKSAPAYSLSSRQKPLPPPTLLFPGPGTYESVYRVVVKKSPMYSMGIKHKGPSDEHMKPGPGAHCPEKVNLTHVPAYSFGIKHSPYLGRFRDIETYDYNRLLL